MIIINNHLLSKGTHPFMDGHHMFSIYGTLIIVIVHRSYINLRYYLIYKNQHGIRTGLGLTPSWEGPGKWKLELEHHGLLK